MPARHGHPLTLAEIDELDALSRRRALTIEESLRLEAAIRKQQQATREWHRRSKYAPRAQAELGR